jgi:hypothetical protein
VLLAGLRPRQTGLLVRSIKIERIKSQDLTTAEREELTRLRRENRKLKEEREILSKAAAWFATEKRSLEALFGFVKANQATHPVGMMCRLLQVSRSGFYAWLARPMSARARADIALTARIHEIYRRSRETYGSPNIHADGVTAIELLSGRIRPKTDVPSTGDTREPEEDARICLTYGDQRYEVSAIVDLLANLSVPGVPQLTLIEPYLDASSAHCRADALSRLCILRGVA